MTSTNQAVSGETDVRILVVLPSNGDRMLRSELKRLARSTTFVDRAEDLAQFVRNGETYEVALLPVSLPDMDWWTIWGELGLLDQRPAILVYTQTSSFQLWSGVLEAGGHDVLVAPFTRERVKEAVLRAAASFKQQSQS